MAPAEQRVVTLGLVSDTHLPDRLATLPDAIAALAPRCPMPPDTPPRHAG
ncbi:MAG: hypothetical protein IT340_22860 [Chloroflexi bacterium]|nr:hypothetical protein [Chloroflexota bacterium]